VEEVLSRAREVAEEAEVFFISAEETQVHFETNRLKHMQSTQQTSLALRLVRDGKIGYAITTAPGNGQALVESALETARFGTVARFQLPAMTSYPSIDVYSADVESVPLEKMIGLGEEMVAAITEHTLGILCAAQVSRGVSSVRLMNSRGGQAQYRKSHFSLAIEGTLINGTDMLFVGDGASSCKPILDSKPVSVNVIQQLELARNQAVIATGAMPVIFTSHGVASALIMPLMAAFNGKTVLEGASPVGRRLGKKVFDSALSLYDDPTLGYRPHSRPCDDEGVPSRRTPLIEAGKVTGFLYDLQTAALAGKQSTGHGGRVQGGLPAPAPSTFVIPPGDAAFEEMVQDMKEGLVVEQLMGAEQGNVLGGDFSGNVLLGYKVENGKIAGRVKNTMVSGNVYQLLKEIAAVGSEARWVGGFLQTPPLYFPRLSVASEGGGA